MDESFVLQGCHEKAGGIDTFSLDQWIEDFPGEGLFAFVDEFQHVTRRHPLSIELSSATILVNPKEDVVVFITADLIGEC